MARTKLAVSNIDNSQPSVYLEGRIKDNTGGGDGTPVSELIYGDLHQTFAKLMHLAKMNYSGLPDNEVNGYQLVDALRALASKNDHILSITKSGDVLTIPAKISALRPDESFVCLAAVDLGNESQVRGTLDNTNKAASFEGEFKTGEYVRLVNKTNEIQFIRLADHKSFAQMAAFFELLKKATQAQEDVGTSDEVATTPKSNKTVFAKRVNGTLSNDYLASAEQNGLLSIEQFNILANLGNNRLRNVGYIAGIDVDNVGLNDTVSSGGDIISARSSENTTDGTIIEITFANAMDDINYKLHCSIESNGNIEGDNDLLPLVWRKKSTTKAEIYLEESSGFTQNLKVHVDVIQL